jgi:glycine/D-amino acid oxidase-like deaminating enzyme
LNILIVSPITSNTILQVLADNIFYRPDLPQKNPAVFLQFIQYQTIDALVCQEWPEADFLKKWAEYSELSRFVCQVSWVGSEYFSKPVPQVGGVRMESYHAATEALALSAALKGLENFRLAQYAKNLQALTNTSMRPNGLGKKVAMVGAGLVNLVSANRLMQEGFQLDIIDGGPDPRLNAHWTEYGCSRGGDDARMFTLSEMDNYNDREVSPSMNNLFHTNVTDRGWNVYRDGVLGLQEQAWVNEFLHTPTWLADSFNDDIFAFNRESMPLWDEWISRDPDLFEGSLIRKDILRIYSDPAQYQAACLRQAKIGATLHVLSQVQIAQNHPALAAAVVSGQIAGGVMVRGFTINAHKFIHLLLDRLQAQGAQFTWSTKVRDVAFDYKHQVKGLNTHNALVTADYYVISPGAYASGLLQGTRSEKKIHGVLGAWLRIENLGEPLTHSLKLARKGHITEDANITVATDALGKPILIIGSGYGHTGIDPKNINPDLLMEIYQGLVDTAKKYFPAAHAHAEQAGTLESSFKYCVRPWTATGLGLFEILNTPNQGVCVITGGHNTGGFTQAPAIAEAVTAAMARESHPMHRAYDPDRYDLFMHLHGNPNPTPTKHAPQMIQVVEYA